MKKVTILILAALFLSGNYCLAQKTLKLKTAADSASYCIGVLGGASLQEGIKNIGFTKFNSSICVSGYSDGMGEKKTPLISKEAAGDFLQNYIQALNAEKGQENKVEGEKFLAGNKNKEGVQQTASGLQYKIINPGTGTEKPSESSLVTVHYTGYTLDGKVFDSSYDRNEPATFSLNQVIRGWTEGVQLMSRGAKYMFWIPSDLAYGESAPGGTIKANSALIFEVELIDFKDNSSEATSENNEEAIDVDTEYDPYRVVGDYRKVKPEDSDVLSENETEMLLFNDHYFDFNGCEFKIMDKNKNTLFNSESCENDYIIPSFYVPEGDKKDLPLILLAEKVDNDAFLFKASDVYVIDQKSFTCKKAGTINILIGENNSSDYPQNIEPFLKINNTKDGIKFSFDAKNLIYGSLSANETLVPAEDFYYLYTKKQGLQAKGKATELSFYQRDIKEAKSKK